MYLGIRFPAKWVVIQSFEELSSLPSSIHVELVSETFSGSPVSFSLTVSAAVEDLFITSSM